SAIPDSTFFKADPRYGGSFILTNDYVHYLSVEQSIFKPITHDYSIEVWFKLNYVPIVVKEKGVEHTIDPFLLATPSLTLQCGKDFLKLNNRQITKYQSNQ